jgi:hypothetical protein
VFTILSFVLFIVFSSKPANSSENDSIIPVEVDSTPFDVYISSARDLTDFEISELESLPLSKDIGSDLKGIEMGSTNGLSHFLVCSKKSNMLILREAKYYQSIPMPNSHIPPGIARVDQVSDVAEIRMQSKTKSSMHIPASPVSYNDCIKMIDEIKNRQAKAIADAPLISPILKFTLASKNIRTDSLMETEIQSISFPESRREVLESTGETKFHLGMNSPFPNFNFPMGGYAGGMMHFGTQQAGYVNGGIKTTNLDLKDELSPEELAKRAGAAE